MSNTEAPMPTTPFRSNEEMQAAIQDPRYVKDSAYREDVARRLEAAPPGALVNPNLPQPPAQPFRSDAEITRAVQDPRYNTDAAYRDDVGRRIAAAPGGAITSDSPAPTTPSSTQDPDAHVFERHGGAERCEEIAKWWAGYAGPEQKARWNAALEAGDFSLFDQAAYEYGLWTGRMTNGVKIGTKASAQGAAKPFASAAERNAAVSDTRYRTDAAYRAEVEARLAADPMQG